VVEPNMVGQAKPAIGGRKVTTRIRTIIATLAATFAVALTFAGPAGAQPKGDTKPQGCPVEDENGNVSYVPIGTRIGLFVCGSDGEWHFGWLVDGRVSPPKPTAPKVPHTTVQVVDRAP
jgi:hypothetical protein